MARKIEPVIALKKVFLVYPQIPDTRKRPFLTTVQKAKSNEQVNLYSRLSYLIFPAPGSQTCIPDSQTYILDNCIYIPGSQI